MTPQGPCLEAALEAARSWGFHSPYWEAELHSSPHVSEDLLLLMEISWWHCEGIAHKQHVAKKHMLIAQILRM